MLLRALRLRSFRAHTDTSLALAPKVNLLYGPNGAGKTNVLEAVHYLCLTKSFLASSDRYVLRQGAPYFEVEGTFDTAARTGLTVRVAYVPREGKQAFVNGAPLDRLADLVGQLPVVVFAPQDQALTADGPDERRRFVNNILSQEHPVYLDDLLKYRRARRQRNELLKQFRRRGPAPPRAVLDSWTAELADLGARIVHRRLHFVHAFAAFLHDAYRRVEAVAERPSLTYETVADLAPDASLDAVRRAFRAQLADVATREQERGTTLVGPQRDELVFRLDGMEVRRYGSQGQHRTFGMALKLAQYFYLRDRLGDPPLLLLDDAFGKLDPERTAVFLDLLTTDAIGQSLVTATRRAPFAATVSFGAPAHRAQRVERRDGHAHLAPAEAHAPPEAPDAPAPSAEDAPAPSEEGAPAAERQAEAPSEA